MYVFSTHDIFVCLPDFCLNMGKAGKAVQKSENVALDHPTWKLLHNWTWTICVPKGGRIELTFTAFDTEWCFNCDCDKLVIYDSLTASGDVLKVGFFVDPFENNTLLLGTLWVRWRVQSTGAYWKHVECHDPCL